MNIRGGKKKKTRKLRHQSTQSTENHPLGLALMIYLARFSPNLQSPEHAPFLRFAGLHANTSICSIVAPCLVAVRRDKGKARASFEMLYWPLVATSKHVWSFISGAENENNVLLYPSLEALVCLYLSVNYSLLPIWHRLSNEIILSRLVCAFARA